jgi:hypothetical protein
MHFNVLCLSCSDAVIRRDVSVDILSSVERVLTLYTGLNVPGEKVQHVGSRIQIQNLSFISDHMMVPFDRTCCCLSAPPKHHGDYTIHGGDSIMTSHSLHLSLLTLCLKLCRNEIGSSMHALQEKSFVHHIIHNKVRLSNWTGLDQTGMTSIRGFLLWG